MSDTLSRQIDSVFGCTIAIADFEGGFAEQRNVSERVCFHHLFSVGFLDECLMLFLAILCVGSNDFNTLLLTSREGLLSIELHPSSFCIGINCLFLFSTFTSLVYPDFRDS